MYPQQQCKLSVFIHGCVNGALVIFRNTDREKKLTNVVFASRHCIEPYGLRWLCRPVASCHISVFTCTYHVAINVSNFLYTIISNFFCFFYLFFELHPVYNIYLFYLVVFWVFFFLKHTLLFNYISTRRCIKCNVWGGGSSLNRELYVDI